MYLLGFKGDKDYGFKDVKILHSEEVALFCYV